jgi:hypothetical protein
VTIHEFLGIEEEVRMEVVEPKGRKEKMIEKWVEFLMAFKGGKDKKNTLDRFFKGEKGDKVKRGFGRWFCVK